ncbi:MAG: tRNA epoxyqueuosine(34) reductase QueG [Rhodobacteraceae bacterium]|nr:tRNA epoxyqueuosine(34) reductase QueG [Paracoccaceae bacterium]
MGRAFPAPPTVRRDRPTQVHPVAPDFRERLRARAFEEGFAGFGVTRPDAVPEIAERLRLFVAEGCHGQMDWMADRMDWRGAPGALWPEAKSIIMLAESYARAGDPTDVHRHPDKGAISIYAQGRDYHDIIKKRLKRLGRWMIETAGGQIKVFVDTAPVMEKPLAAAAGLGWQGKHTNLLGRTMGNWVFLGSIFTTLDLAPDKPEVSRCGSCTRCLHACPTNAFPAPYRIDARRCISYLTIEHAGPVDEELRSKMGNRIYGCDDCLAACPWNKFAVAASDLRYLGSPEPPDLAALALLDDAAFRTRFAGSPVKRSGRNRMVRNVCYAIGNSGLPLLKPSVQALTDDEDPAVADAARWAVEQLS